jgi:hypothetical protein
MYLKLSGMAVKRLLGPQARISDWGDRLLHHQPMDEFGIKVGNGNIKSVLYLRDENKHVLVKGLDCYPPVGTEVVIDGKRWRVVHARSEQCATSDSEN